MLPRTLTQRLAVTSPTHVSGALKASCLAPRCADSVARPLGGLQVPVRRLLPLILLGLAALLPAAGRAAPAAPLPLGNGVAYPWVFVDRQGVTHLTWNVTSGTSDRLFYRRALPGQTQFEPARE